MQGRQGPIYSLKDKPWTGNLRLTGKQPEDGDCGLMYYMDSLTLRRSLTYLMVGHITDCRTAVLVLGLFGCTG